MLDLSVSIGEKLFNILFMNGHTIRFLEWILSSCTDRRMTAYVLGTRPRMRENIPDESLGKSKNDNVHSGSNSQLRFRF